jgi:acyl-CoA synthetase (AMP-forming)/AMP-acid ligase II
MQWAEPTQLADLFAVFAALDHGQTVGLLPGPSAVPPAPLPATEHETLLGVCSSGSTGRPKLIWRRWREVRAGPARSEQLQGWTWASPFEPFTFAGVQVALQAWTSAGKVLSLGRDWGLAWHTLRNGAVDALSCTPTYVDLLLQNEPPEPDSTPEPGAIGAAAGQAPEPPGVDLCLRQITLGGEALRPSLGTRLAQRFPNARFTVIYATAELGVLMKSHRLDGWYEVHSLAKAFPRWRLNAGVLEVQLGELWQTTGDQVELKGDLLRVIGRAGAVANVAGTKVSLAEVSELAEQVPGVRRAAAVAEPSPITGQIVCLKYATDPDYDPGAVTAALRAHLQSCLRKEAWPRKWVLDDVGPEVNAKRRLLA